MNARAKLGIALLAIAALIWFFTPQGVTWGNHHYVKHWLAGVCALTGAVFLLTGTRD